MTLNYMFFMVNFIVMKILVILTFIFSQSFAWAQLNPQLKPQQSDEISTLFENVVAVQRKAKVKKGSFLFHPSLSLDFSDNPYTMYGLGLSFGYAPSEFWEVYLSYTPSYITNERNISKKVRELGPLATGETPEVAIEKSKSSYGLEVNWAPIYGKDSWGPYWIVRSDTFLHFGAYQVKYTQGSGNKLKLALGKTFFIKDYFNLRVQAGVSQLETVSNTTKQNVLIGLIESGVVFYF